MTNKRSNQHKKKAPRSYRESSYIDTIKGVHLSESYKFTEILSPVLNNPAITVQTLMHIDEGFTYRRINEWSEKRLILGSRDNVRGWRRFSFVDVVKLQIVLNLRRIGLPVDRIRIILDELGDYSYQGKKVKMLEHFIMYALVNGISFVLVIDGNNCPFLDIPVSLMYVNNPFDKDGMPLVVLPFSHYAWSIEAPVDGRRPVLEDLRQLLLTEKEKRILEIIQDKKFKEIIINKGDNHFKVTAKTIKQGKFSEQEIIKAVKDKDYQNVTVVVNAGQSIVLKKDESYLV